MLLPIRTMRWRMTRWGHLGLRRALRSRQQKGASWQQATAAGALLLLLGALWQCVICQHSLNVTRLFAWRSIPDASDNQNFCVVAVAHADTHMHRHLMAPQQASSPVPPSPQQEGAPGSLSRSKAGGRDTGASRRGALRAGSDAHCFSSLNSKRHKLAPGEMAHPGVVLSVSGEWSAGAGGGHDSIPDMRLPAAIVGDDGGPEA